MQEENIVSQQNSSTIIKTSTIKKEKIKTSVKVMLVIAWIAYAPAAFFLFAISAMAGDSPYTPAWQVLLAILLINGVPLIIMIASTLSVIKNNTIRPKITSNRYVFWILILWLVASLLQSVARAVFH